MAQENTAFSEDELERLIASIPEETLGSVPASQNAPQSNPESLEALRAFASQGEPTVTQSNPESLKALRSFATGDDSDPESVSLVEDAERFSVRKAVDTGNILAGYVNKGLVGNFMDLPFVLGNVVSEALGSDLRSPLPSQNLLGFDTGVFFDPERASTDKALKKSLRPLGVGLEFGVGFALPQAALARTAGGMTGSAIKQTTFGVSDKAFMAPLRQKFTPRKGPQALAPTSVARAPLPVGSKSAGGSVAQDLTSQGANTAFLLTSGLSGGGAFAGSLLSDGNPMAELAGGIVTPVAALLGAKTVGTVKQQFDLFRSGYDFLGKNKATEAAITAIASHAENPAIALQNLRIALNKGQTGSLAVLTKDEGIAGLTKYMQKRSPTGAAEEGVVFNSRLLELDKRTARELADVVNNISDEAADGFFANFIQGRETALQKSVSGMIAEAEKRAATDAERASSGLISQSEASKALSAQIQAADDAATKGLDEVWATVPNNFVNKKNVLSFAKNALNKTSARTDQEALAVGNTFDKYINALIRTGEKGRIPVKELITFRSNILREIRNMQGNRQSNSYIEAFGQQLQNDAMDLILRSPGGARYKAAANETKIIKDIFDRATFSQKDPETLGKNILASGEKGVANIDEMAKMAGYNEGILGAMDDYIRAAFHATAVKRDPVTPGVEIVDPAAGQRFLKKHYEVLQKETYAPLRAELEDAVRSQVVSQNLQNKGPKFMADRARQSFNTFAEFEFPTEAVNSIIRSKNPAKDAKLLVRQANKDKSGQALEGLQRTFVDSILSKAFKFDDGVATGVNRITPAQYAKLKNANKEIFSNNPESIKILDDVFSQIDSMVKAKGAKQVDAQMAADALSDALIRMAGVTIGGSRGLGKITGSPLMTAGATSQFMRKYLGAKPIENTFRAMEEMIINPALYKDELTAALKATDEVEAIMRTQSLIDRLSIGVPAAMSPEDYEPEVRY